MRAKPKGLAVCIRKGRFPIRPVVAALPVNPANYDSILRRLKEVQPYNAIWQHTWVFEANLRCRNWYKDVLY